MRRRPSSFCLGETYKIRKKMKYLKLTFSVYDLESPDELDQESTISGPPDAATILEFHNFLSRLFLEHFQEFSEGER